MRIKTECFCFRRLKACRNPSFFTVTIWADVQAAAASTSDAWHRPNKWNYSLEIWTIYTTLLLFANSAHFTVSCGFYIHNPDHGLHFISNIEKAFFFIFTRNDSGNEEVMNFNEVEKRIGN